MAEINVYDYDFLLGASRGAQQEIYNAQANTSAISLIGTTDQIVGFDLLGNPAVKLVGGDVNGAGLAFSGDILTATLPQNLKTIGTPTFNGLTLTDQTAGRLLYASPTQTVASSALTYNPTTKTLGAVDSVDFNATPSNALVSRRLQWDDSEGTLALGLKVGTGGGSVALHLGVDHLTQITNKTGATLLKTEFRVIRAGNSAGVNRISGILAQADSEANSTDILGIVCADIGNNQEGFVVTAGEVSGVDTTGAAYGETWNEGDTLYLSPSLYGSKAGALTKTRPQAPNHLVIIGYVASKNSSTGRILVHLQSSWETSELHDVQFGASPPLAGSLLIRDESAGVWKPAQLTAGGNVTITNDDGEITINSINQGASVSSDLLDVQFTTPSPVAGSLLIRNETDNVWETAQLTAGNNVIITNNDGAITINSTSQGTFDVAPYVWFMT